MLELCCCSKFPGCFVPLMFAPNMAIYNVLILFFFAVYWVASRFCFLPIILAKEMSRKCYYYAILIFFLVLRNIGCWTLRCAGAARGPTALSNCPLRQLFLPASGVVYFVYDATKFPCSFIIHPPEIVLQRSRLSYIVVMVHLSSLV